MSGHNNIDEENTMEKLQQRVIQLKDEQKQQIRRQVALRSELNDVVDKTKQNRINILQSKREIEDSLHIMFNFIEGHLQQNPTTNNNDENLSVNPTAVTPQQSDPNQQVNEVTHSGVCGGCSQERFSVRFRCRVINGKLKFVCPLCHKAYVDFRHHIKKCYVKTCGQCHP